MAEKRSDPFGTEKLSYLLSAKWMPWYRTFVLIGAIVKIGLMLGSLPYDAAAYEDDVFLLYIRYAGDIVFLGLSVAVFLGLKKRTKPAYYLNLAFLGFQIVIGMLFAGLSIVYAPGGAVLAYEFSTVVIYVLVYVNPNLIYFMNRRELFGTSDESI